MRTPFHLTTTAAALLFAVGCSHQAARTNEVVAILAAKIPLEPTDTSWDKAPEHVEKLLLQDLVEPRLMKASTPEVLVQALVSNNEIAFRLRWTDPTVDDLPGAARFMDQCAIQIPQKIEPNVPEPQMGNEGRPVEITFWRADWQASVNGRADNINALFPNASIDHYPFESKALEPGSAAQKEMAVRYAPAQAVGNRRVGPRDVPVEDLLAQGPGTLAPAPSSTSKGKGIRTKDGWSVVIIRKLPEGLSAKQRSQIAFAVWQGSAQEAGARKMRSGWVPLAIRGAK
jgi:hypothetical protein